MDYAPFHIGYEERQQRLFFGSDESLVMELEATGGGLDPEPPWNLGGPFLVRHQHSPSRIVGWLRGTNARPNAWEAWGVVVSEGIDLTYWPWWAWLLEQPDKDQLAAFGERLARGVRAERLESAFPRTTAAHITAAYAFEPPDGTIPIRITDPNEALVMPWLWLLGPRQPLDASIGPPRQVPAVLRNPLTYEPLIEHDISRVRLQKALYIEQVLQQIQLGHADVAFDAVKELRSLPPARRRNRIVEGIRDHVDELPEPIFTREEKTNVGSKTDPPNLAPNKSKPSSDGDGSPKDPLMLRADIIIVLLGMILIVDLIGLFLRGAPAAEQPRTETSATSTTAESDTSLTTSAAMSDTTASAPSPIVTCDFNDANQREDVMRRFRTHAATLTSVAPSFAQLTSDAAREWNDTNQQRIAIAARQLFLREQCGKPTLKLDGFAGSATTQADCAVVEWDQIRTNNQAALTWLCARFRAQ